MSIPEFFAGKTIFLTGATGSVGSVFLEKLLRSCKGVKKVYLLTRPKNGISAFERIKVFLQLPLFANLDENDIKKVCVVNGDVTSENLGLCLEDHKILTAEVDLVFHAAARVFFNASLKSAISSNLIGSKHILDFCHKIVHLESLIYVSTAYSNCILNETRERLYPTDHSPLDIIDYVQKNTTEVLESETKRLIGKHPNTYTFSKQLAEHLLNDGREHIKLAIVRPSIVIGTWKDPFPGWIDGSSGATGFIAGVGAGCFRTSQVSPQKVADLVPSDILVNALLAAAWSLAQPGNLTLQIVHVTSGLKNPITWGQYTDYIDKATVKYPIRKILWYPSVKARSAQWRITVAVHLFQLWPSYFLDLLRAVCNLKPKESLVSIQQKFIRGLVHTKYFCMQHWKFHNENLDSLSNSLLPEDQAKFSLSIREIDWKVHLENCVLGIREHFHKDSPSSLPKAQSNLRRWKMIHFGAPFAAFAWLVYMFQYVFADIASSLAASLIITMFLMWV